MPPISLAEVARKVTQSILSPETSPRDLETPVEARLASAPLALISDPESRAAILALEERLRDDLMAVASAFYAAGDDSAEAPADEPAEVVKAAPVRTAIKSPAVTKLRRRSAKRE